MTGSYLFDGESAKDILEKNKICDLSDVEEEFIMLSPLARNLMMRLIEPDQYRRPSAKEALRHPWFSQDKSLLSQILKLNGHVSHINK